MNYTEEVSKKINELLEKNYDAQKGFMNAADNVDSTNLKTYFKSKAAERENFSDELKREIVSFGEKPVDSGSLTGDAHRTWMNIKSALSSNDEESILEEVQRGEKASLEDYNEVLSKTSLPQTTEAMLTRHRNAIQNSVNNAKRYESIVE
ncbi:ferritin-like domain-containing protein [Galbibacter mesophilus]|uniref:ferritin-like domain-containing protein n=1 Tax=Galbibacter mesophilus TaxID=379069 RepID=UPI00191CF78A|nr:PA2169 family four-helix-bundle protein [Galbibacter mesophilus]MCM5664258.1 PA2169 family four-helix-bundle protein [Galbibacter mesophilus]